MSARSLRKHPEVLAAHLSLDGRRALDIGCGDGALVRLMARQGAWAVGLDPQASGAATTGAAPLPLVRGLGEALPFADGSFDLVVFFNALHHVPAALMRPALIEALRVLRPGGLLAILEPLAEGAYFELMRPIEDETEVRAVAQETLNTLTPGDSAEHLVREEYDAPLAFADFAAWEARVLAVDPSRAERLADERPRLAERFPVVAERDGEGRYCFRQPSRLDLFRRL